jgi:type II secretory pathway component PulF
MKADKAKINFFNSLATMENAGVPLLKSLRHKYPAPIGKIAKEAVREIEKDGKSLSESLSCHPDIFTPLEVSMLKAAEHTASMPEILKTLAANLQRKKRAVSKISSEIAYPVILYHACALLMPFISFIINKSSVTLLIFQAFLFLAPLYTVALMVYLSLRPGNFISGLSLKILSSFPVTGTIIKKLDTSRFLSTSAMAVEAGMTVPEAVKISADVCLERDLKNIMLKTSEYMKQRGCSFTEALKGIRKEKIISEPLMSILETGELSGSLSESFSSAGKILGEEGETLLEHFARFVPKIIYAGIMIFAAIKIIGFFSEIFQKTSGLGL